MGKITYQPADRSDVPALIALLSKMVRQYEDPTVQDMHRALEWCQTKIEGNYAAYTCIYVDGIKAGYYHLIPQMDLRTELDDLYILPEFQKQGIGTAVIEKILQETDEPIYLYVFQKNKRAVALYTKMGFQITKILSPTRMIMEYHK